MARSSKDSRNASRTQKSAAVMIATAIVALIAWLFGIEIPLDLMVAVVTALIGITAWYMREAVS